MGQAAIELHHTAYVVPDLQASLAAWQAILAAHLEAGPVRVGADQVDVCFLRFPGGRVELVCRDVPAESAAAPGTARPDHLCFLCDDLDRRIAEAREQGGVVVRSPVASEAFDGRRMCFVLYRNIGLIEWVER